MAGGETLCYPLAMPACFRRVIVLVLLLASVAFARDPQTVVVWLSIDGLRGDYADKHSAPTLREMMRDGAYSRQLAGAFPTLTFPSHVTQATGTPPSVHGVVGNAFLDRATWQRYSLPDDSSLVRSESLWESASRQGARAIVLDWPMSYSQQGAHRAATFSPAFDPKLTDGERFGRMLKAWTDDTDANPPRLLMSYAASVDSTGHRFGPDSPELAKALLKVDAEVASTRDRAIAIFRQKMQAGDRLFMVVTGDHGMRSVHTHLSPAELLGHLPDDVRLIEASTMLQIHCTAADAQQRELRLNEIATKLAGRTGIRFLRQPQFPPDYLYPERAPDALVLAEPGIAFSSKPPGPAAAHGYPEPECPEMNALLVIWQYERTLGGKDLGKATHLQLHPTVCSLLGIRPAEHAKTSAIVLP